MDAAHDTDATLRLFAGYAALVAAVCAVHAAAAPLALGSTAVVHAAAAVLLWRAAGPSTAEPGTGRLVLPWFLWLASWVMLGRIFAWTAPATYDRAIAATDLAVFGGPWHRHLAEVLPWRGVAAVMQGAYLSYYLIIVGPPLVLARRIGRAAVARYTRHVLAVYLACFVVYLVLPVLGPRAAAELAAGGGAAPGPAGGLAGLAALARHLGDSAGTAFPSSHCAAALAAALAAGSFARPGWRVVLAAWALLIAAATVYTGNHYLLDSAAGVALTLAVRAAVQRRTAYSAGGGGAPASVRSLPR